MKKQKRNEEAYSYMPEIDCPHIHNEIAKDFITFILNPIKILEKTIMFFSFMPNYYKLLNGTDIHKSTLCLAEELDFFTHDIKEFSKNVYKLYRNLYRFWCKSNIPYNVKYDFTNMSLDRAVFYADCHKEVMEKIKNSNKLDKNLYILCHNLECMKWIRTYINDTCWFHPINMRFSFLDNVDRINTSIKKRVTKSPKRYRILKNKKEQEKCASILSIADNKCLEIRNIAKELIILIEKFFAVENGVLKKNNRIKNSGFRKFVIDKIPPLLLEQYASPLDWEFVNGQIVYKYDKEIAMKRIMKTHKFVLVGIV